MASKPYFVYCDDDYVFTESTKLEKLEGLLNSNPSVSIAGGRCVDFGNALRPGPSMLNVKNGTMTRKFLPETDDDVGCDMTSQFFMGRTKFFQANDVRWDERLGLKGEHEMFFWTFPGKVVVSNTTTCNHYPSPRKAHNYDLVKEIYGFDIEYDYSNLYTPL